MFSLDTSAAIDVIRRPTGAMRERLVAAQTRQVLGVSSIVMFELESGVRQGTSPHGRERLSRFVDGISEIFDFDADDAETAGEVRHLLASRGEKIGPYDTLIAGQALRRGLVLVTANPREFKRVPGLAVENWRE